MLVRDAVDRDAGAIAQVHVETWQVSYRGVVPDGWLDALSVPARAERWRRILAAHAGTGQCIVVAETEGGVVGFANAGPHGSVGNDEEAGHPAYEAEFLCLYVLPASQRQGVGALLMRATAARLRNAGLKSASLWCFADGPAVPFYGSLGGKIVARKAHVVGGKVLGVVCFAWSDLAPLVAPAH